MGLLLYQQFQKVSIYFDDYAYYSLSYATSFKATKDFTLVQLMNFLKAHYMESNGRLFYFFLWLILYWLGGLSLVQLSASLIMLAVLFLLWKIVSLKFDEQHKIFAAFLICVFYWLLDLVFLSQSVYWFAAFFLYVTPIGLLILAAWFYFFKENTLPNRLLILFLIFAAGWTQEQQAAATFAFAMFLAVHAFYVKKERIPYVLLYPFSAALSLTIVVMSPGIQQRITSADRGMHLLDKLLLNASKVTYLLGTASSWRINLFIFLSLLIISGYNFKKTNVKILKYFDIIQISLNVYLIYVYSLKQMDVELFVANQSNILVIVSGTVIVLSLTIQIIRFELIQNNQIVLLIFLSAMASIAVLLLVPQLPNRLLMFFILTMLGICAQAICCLLPPPHTVTTIITVVLVIMALRNGTAIYRGYAENYEVLKENDRTIEAIATSTISEDTAIEIHLKKLPYPKYCAVSPDDENYSQVLRKFMNNYYSLPDDTIYVYTDN